MSDSFPDTDHSGRPGTTINLFRGCLVVTLPAHLSEETLSLLRRDLLDQLARAHAKRVVMDCAGLEILDPEEFRSLGRIISMAGLLGAGVILAGLRPGIVASLITMAEDTGKIRAALNLDDALQILEEEDSSRHVPDLSPAESETPDSQGLSPLGDGDGG